jgi:hypothetical protein
VSPLTDLPHREVQSFVGAAGAGQCAAVEGCRCACEKHWIASAPTHATNHFMWYVDLPTWTGKYSPAFTTMFTAPMRCGKLHWGILK